MATIGEVLDIQRKYSILVPPAIVPPPDAPVPTSPPTAVVTSRTANTLVSPCFRSSLYLLVPFGQVGMSPRLT
jgi:hypothetical protein